MYNYVIHGEKKGLIKYIRFGIIELIPLYMLTYIKAGYF